MNLLRGSPERLENFKEQFQLGYLGAVVAAAGCVISGVPTIDEGIDVRITHMNGSHTSEDKMAYLEIQLKATARSANFENGFITATMSKKRYDYFRTPNPTMQRIAVIMSLPEPQCDWVSATHEFLTVRHCAYWVNLAGAEASDAENPTFRAPTENILDDVALCNIMSRIGQGGRP